MSVIQPTKPAEHRLDHDLAPEALAEVAAHSRQIGFCLLLFSPDGQLLYHDAGSGPFFDQFVVPALRGDQATVAQLRAATAQVSAHSVVQSWSFVPGTAIAVAPHVDRRTFRYILAVAARTTAPESPDDLLRLCSALGLDAAWFHQEAARLPSYSSESAGRAAGVFLAMLRDKLRVCRLEGELNTLSAQLANAYEELSLIELISGGMRLNRRPAEFFKNACVELMQVLGVRGMGVAVSADNARQEPVLYGDLALAQDQVQRLGTQLQETLSARPATILTNDLAGDPAFSWLAPSVSRLITVPLQRGQDVLGCFFALDKRAGDFDSVDSKLLTSIANEAAIYIENAVLFGDLQGLLMGLMHSLTSAIDAKDAYTCGHSERVALLSRYLASQVGLSDAEVDRIYMAGLLHDVGKIGVPESVLQKTGRLTPEEFDQMKKHPEIGARILADVRQLADILPGVLYHHERYDGRGYPTGLAARNIPLMGRIICLADCFDAMTSNRTYRKALPIEVALAEIRRCAGTQFDPELAEVFLRLQPDQVRLLLCDHQQEARRLLELQEVLRAA
jgi:HD-GYP domain-containing protein (c-di-GMP phosphodiesterase class II)